MTLPRYATYKDSGIEWVGDVPDHWGLKPLFSVVVERTDSNKGMKEDNLLSLSYGRIVPKDMASNDGLLPESFETYQVVQPGDLVFRLTDLQNDKRSLRSALVEATGIITSAYVAVTPIGLDSRYAHYLFRAYDTTKVFYSMGGGLRQSMKFFDLKRLPVVLPPSAEQTAIVAFLDHETAKIDALVAEQERLIELLNEKRQAVVTHAVLKGLNPDVPMKDSGVEWLGKVPAHWDVTTCGRYASILSGFAFPSTGFDTDPAQVRLLRGINVGVGSLRWDEAVYWRRSKNDGLDAYELRVGDLVVGMDRPLIAEGMRVARVAAEDVPCLLLQRVAMIRTRPELQIEFLEALLTSRMFVAHFEPDTTGVSVPHISPDQIRSFRIPLPPLVEQAAIVTHVNTTSSRLDALMAEARRAIALLQERRTALISAAVTGQIDVRDAAGRPA